MRQIEQEFASMKLSQHRPTSTPSVSVAIKQLVKAGVVVRWEVGSLEAFFGGNLDGADALLACISEGARLGGSSPESAIQRWGLTFVQKCLDHACGGGIWCAKDTSSSLQAGILHDLKPDVTIYPADARSDSFVHASAVMDFKRSAKLGAKDCIYQAFSYGEALCNACAMSKTQHIMVFMSNTHARFFRFAKSEGDRAWRLHQSDNMELGAALRHILSAIRNHYTPTYLPTEWPVSNVFVRRFLGSGVSSVVYELELCTNATVKYAAKLPRSQLTAGAMTAACGDVDASVELELAALRKLRAVAASTGVPPTGVPEVAAHAGHCIVFKHVYAALEGSMTRPMVEQLFGVLKLAKAAGVVHRDLRPENLMLLSEGSAGSEEQLVVIDWAFSASAKADETFDPLLFAGAVTYGSDRILHLLCDGAADIVPSFADDLVSAARICLDYSAAPNLRIRRMTDANALIKQLAEASLAYWRSAPRAWDSVIEIAVTGDVDATREAVLKFYPVA